jgi:hypothetical protein
MYINDAPLCRQTLTVLPLSEAPPPRYPTGRGGSGLATVSNRGGAGIELGRAGDHQSMLPVPSGAASAAGGNAAKASTGDSAGNWETGDIGEEDGVKRGNSEGEEERKEGEEYERRSRGSIGLPHLPVSLSRTRAPNPTTTRTPTRT